MSSPTSVTDVTSDPSLAWMGAAIEQSSSSMYVVPISGSELRVADIGHWL